MVILRIKSPFLFMQVALREWSCGFKVESIFQNPTTLSGEKRIIKPAISGLLFVNRPILKPTNSSKKQISLLHLSIQRVTRTRCNDTCNKHFLFNAYYQVLICSYFYKKVITVPNSSRKTIFTTISIDKETVALVEKICKRYSQKKRKL